MGVYVFNARFLFDQLCRDATLTDSAHDFGRNIIPSLVATRRVYAFPFLDENRKQDAYWRDVGTIDSYYQANIELTGVEPQLNLYDDHWPVRTYQPNLPPPKFVFNSKDRCGVAHDSIVCAGRDHLGRQRDADDRRLANARQQLRGDRGLDHLLRREHRPAGQDPPGDHRQGRARSPKGCGSASTRKKTSPTASP